MTTENIFGTERPWNEVAEGYVDTTMHNLSAYAEEVLEVSELEPSWKVLDLACGPGTASLMLASRVNSVTALDFSEQMLLNFNKKIAEQKIKNIEVIHGDGQNLPFQNEIFDAGFSMFGLMFFPDRIKGFSELNRVLKKSKKAYVTSWAPIEKSSSMKLMLEAMAVINNDNSEPQKAISSLENKDTFRFEMEKAGFRDIEIRPISKSFSYKNAEHFWNHMTKGSAPIVMTRIKLGQELWREKEKLALDFLQKKLGDAEVNVFSDAWLGIGTK